MNPLRFLSLTALFFVTSSLFAAQQPDDALGNLDLHEAAAARLAVADEQEAQALLEAAHAPAQLNLPLPEEAPNLPLYETIIIPGCELGIKREILSHICLIGLIIQPFSSALAQLRTGPNLYYAGLGFYLGNRSFTDKTKNYPSVSLVVFPALEAHISKMPNLLQLAYMTLVATSQREYCLISSLFLMSKQSERPFALGALLGATYAMLNVSIQQHLTAEKQKDIFNVTHCPICFKDFETIQKTYTECGHHLCASCYKNVVLHAVREENNPLCPTCRAQLKTFVPVASRISSFLETWRRNDHYILGNL